MVLVFKSTTEEYFQIVGRDSDGSKRVATATKTAGNRWDLRLEHPSGRHWDGQFFGPNVLDALGELLNDKEVEYRQSRARGHKPAPEMLRDSNRNLPDHAPITTSPLDYRPQRTRR